MILRYHGQFSLDDSKRLENALDSPFQKFRDQELSKRTYAKHVLQWVSQNLYSIDPEDVELTYGDSHTIDPMTDEEIEAIAAKVVANVEKLTGGKLRS